jgi:hypothetical protein
MPARKISPQSFDDILSELGDDPAIPDPHGIRKPNSPKHPAWAEIDPPQKSKIQLNFQDQFPHLESLKKVGLFVGAGGLLITSAVALFLSFNPTGPTQDPSTDQSKQEVSELKKELDLLREEMIDLEDGIYESIDLIEVSIHSLEKTKTKVAPITKTATIPFEPEVRHWRYLGVSKTGDLHRAFFHNGKTTLMVEIGGLLLGDWRLSNADKEVATINHPQGKSLTLKTAISE